MEQSNSNFKNAGHSVIAVQLTLHSVGDYIATVNQTTNQTGGPVTAVGHSHGGHVITNAGLNDSINIRNSSTIEIRIADTWTDHIRQHEYVTKNVQVMEDRIRALIKDSPTPIISHHIVKLPLK